jgi:hypothetical protein
VAAKALELLGVRLDDARARVEEAIGQSGTAPSGSPPFTPRAKKVLELSLRESLQLGHNYIGTEHILLGIVREGEGVGAQVLLGLGADLTRVRQQVVQLVGVDPASVSHLRTGGQMEREGSFQLPGRAPESPIRKVGKSWTAHLVRPGRGPDTFAAAYEELAELVGGLGAELGDDSITISSVDTEQGPGIELSFTRHVDDEDELAEGDEGETI